MDKLTHWFDRARKSYETADVFATAPGKEKLVDQLFFGVRAKKIGAMGIYLEFYQERPGEKISAYVFTYSAPYEEVSEDVSADKITIDIDLAPTSFTEIIASPFDKGNIYSAHLELAFKSGINSKASLFSANARLIKDRHQAKCFKCFDVKMPTVKWPSKNSNISTKWFLFEKFESKAKAFCPNCYGNGSIKSMHIPKADLESGASGYHLYSCNQVSGRESCTVCGGSGAKYLKWFRRENPQLSSLRFIAGDGLQKISTGLI